MLQRSSSFRGRIHLILLTLGIAPYFLAIYAFNRAGMSVSETVALLAIVALLFHLLGFRMLRTFADHLQQFVNEAERHAVEGNLKRIELSENSTIELETLTRHFNLLLNELEESKKKHNELTVQLMKVARDDIKRYQEKLKESEAVQEKLSPYVGANVVEQIRRAGSATELKNEKRLVTVLFADIRGFTRLSETMTPNEIISMLNEYFDEMVRIIHDHNGVLDKFVGDELMAVFGLMQPKEQTSVDAVRAALGMRAASERLMNQRRQQSLPTYQVGIGLNTGEVIAGNVGSQDRMDYTVIGDTVNVGARLEQLSKSDEILISEETARRIGRRFELRLKGAAKLKNRDEPVTCYEVVREIPLAERKLETTLG